LVLSGLLILPFLGSWCDASLAPGDASWWFKAIWNHIESLIDHFDFSGRMTVNLFIDLTRIYQNKVSE